MDIAILGTGPVGTTLAAGLSAAGHRVAVGTRDPTATRARTEPGPFGTPPFSAFLDAHPSVCLCTFAEAAAGAEVVVNATTGHVSLEVLALAGPENLEGKVLLDVSNPLDFSRGMPPTLTVCNDDSLGEQIQRAFPGARVVKALNTVTAGLMTAPRALADGDHTLFLCGDDPAAKATVRRILQEDLGWLDVLDLGGISMARGTEMYLPLWVRLFGALGTPMFSVKVVR